MTLMAPCKCPRKVHPQCLARWQLQQAGRPEEKYCRFCHSTLADWKSHLTPAELKPEVTKVQPIMVVYFEGQIHRIPVKQGEAGLQEFQSQIRTLFRLPDDVDISLTFGCKEPMSGQHLKLEGTGAFDAAVHCASVAAADRQQKLKKSSSCSNLMQGSSSASSSSTASTSAAASGGASGSAGANGRPTPVDRRRRLADEHRLRSRTFTQGSRASPRNVDGTATPPPAGGIRTLLGLLGNGQQQQQQQQQSAPAARRTTTESPDNGRRSPAPAAPSPAAAAPVAPAPAPAPRTPASAASSRRDMAALAAMPVSADNGARRSRVQARYSSRQITELRDVPEIDETVAVGSLSGKFKLHLKAFSRKVARSLSFKNPPGAGTGGSPMASHPVPMEEDDEAEEFHIPARAAGAAQ